MNTHQGVLQNDKGRWYLRSDDLIVRRNDPILPTNIIRQKHLRQGDHATFKQEGKVWQYSSQKELITRPEFSKLTPMFAHERYLLTREASHINGRMLDLLVPIGKGQRGIIVAPPKAGKTMLLVDLAKSLVTQADQVICLLIDERPEEVTEWRKSLPKETQIYASTFDRPAKEHIQLATLCLEKAKRLVEEGKDVVILLDSLTRLARAHNMAAPQSSRVGTGGVVLEALLPVKQFFGAARETEEAGSLTILATCLVETGSRADEIIYEEFKGTGNMEIVLSRRLAEKRIYPALDLGASSTRREDLLYTRDENTASQHLRRVLASLDNEAAHGLLTKLIKQTPDNTAVYCQVIANKQ